MADERDDGPLVLPAGTGPLGDLDGDVAARHLHDFAERLRKRGVGTDAAALLRRQCREIMEAANAGASAANRLDQEAAAARAAHERRLAEIQARLVFLGKSTVPDAYSIVGWDDLGRPVAISRDGGLLVLAMGTLGSGKSHFAVSLAESCLRPVPGLTSARHRSTAVIAFHTNLISGGLPDLLAGLRPNPRPQDLLLLQQRLGVATAAPIPSMTLVVPSWLLDEYAGALQPYMALGLRVLPLKLHLPSLSLTSLEALMGGGDAKYLQRMLAAAQTLGDQLTVQRWHEIIDDDPELNEKQRSAAHNRLRLIGDIAARPGEPGLWDAVAPDTMTIFLLAGRRIGRHDVLPLCMTLLSALSEPSVQHGRFQRLFLMDEINRFAEQSPLWPVLLQVARQIRHQGSMLLLMGQDFRKVPEELLALASIFAMFQVRSAKIVEDTRQRVAGMGGADARQIAVFPKGQALVGAAESTDAQWPVQGRQVHFRPLLCEHGGHTKAEI